MNSTRLASTIVTSFVLAGLLGPGAFGTVALALIYVTLLQRLMQQGLVPALIQRKDLTGQHLDSAFWLTVGSSVVLTLVGALLSGWWARLNGAPDARPVIAALSILVLIKGLVVVQEALLRRHLRFRTLAARTAIASAVGAAVGLTWAIIHPSIWALVAQQLTMEGLGCIVLWASTDWRPRFRFSMERTRELLGFAGKSALTSLAVFANARIDAILIGVYFGAVAVGLYRLASRLVESAIEFAVQPLQHVSLPEFSAFQSDPRKLRERYVQFVRLACLIASVLMAALAAAAEPLMALLGDEWFPAVWPLRMLCIVGLAQSVAMLNGPLIQAVGRPGAQATLTWVSAGVSAAAFVAAGLALQSSGVSAQVLGMATSRAVLFALILVPLGQLVLVVRAVGVGLGGLTRLIGPAVLIALVVCVLASVGTALLGDRGAPPILLAPMSAAVTLAGAFTAIVRLDAGMRTTIVPWVRRIGGKVPGGDAIMRRLIGPAHASGPSL